MGGGGGGKDGWYATFCSQLGLYKAGDTPGDFIRRSRRSANIAECSVPSAAMVAMAIFADRRIKSPISGMSDIGDKIRPHSQSVPVPATFLRSSLGIATKVNQSGWSILSHDFSKWRHERGKWFIFARDFRWRSNSLRSAFKIASLTGPRLWHSAPWFIGHLQMVLLDNYFLFVLLN